MTPKGGDYGRHVCDVAGCEQALRAIVTLPMDAICCPVCGATWSLDDEKPACTCSHEKRTPYMTWIFGSENADA